MSRDYSTGDFQHRPLAGLEVLASAERPERLMPELSPATPPDALERLGRRSEWLVPGHVPAEELTAGQLLVREARRIATALLSGAHMVNTLNTVWACEGCRWAGSDRQLHGECPGRLYEADIVIIGKEPLF